MKAFFDTASAPALHNNAATSAALPDASGDTARARIAVYDSLAAAPRVEAIEARDSAEFIDTVAARAYEEARALGGTIPYTVVREVAENYIHADFREPVVSVLDGGRTLRFADQGPGIADKDKAVLPGYTTANSDAKRYIRGVGSGLPIVQEFLGHAGGTLSIDDNLGVGSVVTISIDRTSVPVSPAAREEHVLSETTSQPYEEQGPLPRLTTRQRQVLSLVMEAGSAGPTLVSTELAVGLSTAYRDLALLEKEGLIVSDSTGKRVLTPRGIACMDELLTR